MAKPHMILFPFMSQGHTLPMLDLAKALASRGVMITVFTTPYNSVSIGKSLSQTENVALEILPFPPCEELPSGCENTEQLPSMDLFLPFVMAVKRLQQPFERSLEKMVRDPIQKEDTTPPLCIVSDYFLWWTQESGSKFDVPRVCFSGMNAYAVSVTVSLALHHPHKAVTADSDPFEVLGLPVQVFLTRSELWAEVRILDEKNPWTVLLPEITRTEQRSHGAILNTFEELEPMFVSHLQSSAYKHVWCLGPTVAWPSSPTKEAGCWGAKTGSNSHVWTTCMDWLDARADRPGSVVYVSFGTHASVPDAQMTEIAWGLLSSRWDFVLVVRSGSWRVPDGFEAKMGTEKKKKGLILMDWVPQSLILSHQAVGGCFSHCGWNSVLESLSCGVPILGWAMMADQYVNEKMVVEELGAGIRILHPTERSPSAVIGREVVRERVDELLGGDAGCRARSKAVEIGRAARRAVREGGSSYKSLSSMIQHFCDLQSGSKGISVMEKYELFTDRTKYVEVDKNFS